MKVSESKLRASRKWKSGHKVELKEYKRQWIEKNRGRVRQYQRGWKVRNRERVRKYEREYLETHPEVAGKRINKQRWTRWQRKEEIVGLLGGVCSVCGYKPIHLCELDIHEVNGRIAECVGAAHSATTPGVLLATQAGFALLKKHLSELVLLCAICHHRLSCSICKETVQSKVDECIAGRYKK